MRTVVLDAPNEEKLQISIDNYFGRFPSAGYGTRLVEQSKGMKDGKPVVWCKITRAESCE